MSLGRLEGLIAATWKRLDPAGAAQAEASARTELGVWVGRSSVHGTSTLFARLDSPDALRVDAALARAAEALRALGDTRSLDQRRAAAMGVLADPQDALDLWSAHAARAAADGTAEQPPPFDHHDRQDPPALGSAPHEPTPAEPTVAVRPSLWRRPDNPTPGRGPGVVLYVHLSDQTLRAGQGVTRVEDIGPMTAATVREWLAGTGARISVRPLLDLAGQTPVDAYEIPTRIADAVRLRTPVDCFPYATGTSRRMDLDHTEPYQPPDHGGPPGQTRTDNLGPLTRRHHRIKTHGHGWAVRQVFEGVFVWRTPHGRHYLVDHTGTTKASSVA